MPQDIPTPSHTPRARRRIGPVPAALLSLALTLGGVLGGSAVVPMLTDPASAQVATAVAVDPVQAAIQQVIEQANHSQAQAFASGDPAPMRDTATTAYFQEMASTNQQMRGNGVSAIQLVSLEWGPISVNGSSATATTFETWRTEFDDGTSEQARNQNDYTLVLANGAWQVQSDDHPSPTAATPADNAEASSVPPTAPITPGDRSSTSHNWSGYASTDGPFTAVSGTWTVPTFNAASTRGVDATWVGIGGVSSRDLIQAGTQQVTTGTGTTRYQAWIEMLPAASRPVPLTVHAGDSVTVDIVEQDANAWLITFTNHTTGQTYAQPATYASSHSSAEWVTEAPSTTRGGILPLDDFGAVTFTAGSAVKQGQTQTIAQTGAKAITMIGGAGNQALATTSALGADGSTFSVNRTAVAAGQGTGTNPRSLPRRRSRGGA